MEKDCSVCRQTEYQKALKVAQLLGLSEERIKAYAKSVDLSLVITMWSGPHGWGWPEDEAAACEVIIWLVKEFVFQATDNLDEHNAEWLANMGVNLGQIHPEVRNWYSNSPISSLIWFNLLEGNQERCECCNSQEYPGFALRRVIGEPKPIIVESLKELEAVMWEMAKAKGCEWVMTATVDELLGNSSKNND
jgi:hypothetical protein